MRKKVKVSDMPEGRGGGVMVGSLPPNNKWDERKIRRDRKKNFWKKKKNLLKKKMIFKIKKE